MSEPDHRFGPFAPAHSAERPRIRAATIAVVLERGLGEDGAPLICSRAGVEPTQFERDFGSVRDCALHVYTANIDEFDRIVFGAVDRERGWPARLRAAAYAALRYVAARPEEARFNFIAMLQAGEVAQAHRDRYVRRVVDLIDEGRRQIDDPDSLPPGLAAGVFGSIYEFLAREINRDSDIASIDRHVPELMYLAVRPYLGEEAARAELTMPVPEVREA